MRTKNTQCGGAPGQGSTSTNTIKQKNSLSTYYLKETLVANKSEDDNIAIASDKELNSSTKCYTWFKNAAHAITYLEQSKNTDPHYYEIVQDIENYSCFIYFDVDRDLYPDRDAHIINDLNNFFDATMNTFLHIFTRFLDEVYNITFEAVYGQTVQVGYALTHTKLSAHVRINVICPNVRVMKGVADNFVRYMLTHSKSKDTDKYFTYIKIQSTKSFKTTIIDPSVYANFRLFRMLYSKKWKTGAQPLLPYKESSMFIKDHMILRYADTMPAYSPVPTINPGNELQVIIDHSKIQNTLELITTTPAPIFHTPQTTVCPNIPTTHLKQVEKFLVASTTVQDFLHSKNIRFTVNKYLTPNVFSFGLDKSKYFCPFAQRIHKSNRACFNYNFNTRCAYYHCFDEECQEASRSKCFLFNINTAYDSLVLLSSINAQKTLHCKQHVIEWNELYNDPCMREYPLTSVLVVRANMGVGKTKMLAEYFLPKHCAHPSTKCLFITYQRLLSVKYAHELESIGFRNYLDYEGAQTLSAKKIIVCLDSLCKVETRNFDFIIIDEITSVLLHFNSQYMTKSSHVCTMLELLLFQASHCVFLDACVDNTIVYDFVEYLSMKKNVVPHYLRNSFVRPTNRQCKLYTNTNPRATNLLKRYTIGKVLAILDQGKRVVITSSTKRFVEELEAELKSHPTAKHKKILAFHSGNNDVKKIQGEAFIKSITECDLFIYSPTITAGVSFELPHFHELVAYIDNTFFTPPVDIVLQQMFRIRQLIDGKMTLFLNNTFAHTLDPTQYPTSSQDIDAFLDKDVNSIMNLYPNDSLCFESPTNVQGDVIAYDKDRLSYKLLRGILLNRNKSLIHFDKVLLNTLKEDYNIECNSEVIVMNEDMIRKATELMKNLKGTMKNTTQIPFSDDVIITGEQYDELCKREKRGEKLTELELQQKWVYHCAFEMWGVSSNVVDSTFYDEFVGQANQKGIQKAIGKFFKMLRCKDMFTETVPEHMSSFKRRLDMIKEYKEYNLELYKTNTRKYYERLIEGHRLMDALFGDQEGYKQRLMQGEEVCMSASVFYEKVKKYLKDLKTDEYDDLISIFDTRNSFQCREDVLETRKSTTCLVQRIVNEAFGMQVSNDHNNSRTNEDLKRLTTDYHQIVSSYNPFALNTHVINLCSTEDDSMDF